jgi:hypothetical protein
LIGFVLKTVEFFDADPDPGIYIPDPQHWFFAFMKSFIGSSDFAVQLFFAIDPDNSLILSKFTTSILNKCRGQYTIKLQHLNLYPYGT